MPIKQIRIHPDDAPWMNQRLKSFIQKRQEAFNIYGVNSNQFKQYRNLVNRERKTCRAKYYESKIQQFKGVTPRKWWQEVQRLSGMKSTNVNVINQIDIEDFSNLTLQEQVIIIIIHFRTNEDQLQADVCKCIALRSCFKLKDDNSFTLVSTQTKIHKFLPLPSSLACQCPSLVTSDGRLEGGKKYYVLT